MSQPQPNDGFEWTQAGPGLVLRCRPLLEIAPHLFTTSAVQLRGDDREWQSVSDALEVPTGGVRLIRQVHGTGVAVVRRGDTAVERQDADIIVSGNPETAVGVRTADCSAILLADRARPVVAAAHAGWRGAMQNVAVAAVAALRDAFGSRPADLVAAVGPSLGACCGEMGPEVVDAFRSAGHGQPDIDRWFNVGPRGRPHFDLTLANRDQLERAGVPAQFIHVAGLCTRCRPDVFHSYRAAGSDAGRMVGAIRPAR